MKLQEVHIQDIRANQPLASDVAIGTLYGVTDEANILERSDGTDWQPYSPASVSGGLNQLTGDVTAGPGIGSQVATIAADAVTYAKIQNVSAASKLLGRGSASGAGNVEEITVGSGLAMTGTTLSATGGASGIDELTGDVTAGPGSGSEAATIANDAVTTAKIINDAVTYAKMQNTAAASILLGRGSAGGAGDPEEIVLGTNLSMSGTTLNAAGGGGGGGGLVLIATRTGSNSAELIFDNTEITSLYENYLFQFDALKPAAGISTSLLFQISDDNGVTWKTGNDYPYATRYLASDATNGLICNIYGVAIGGVTWGTVSSGIGAQPSDGLYGEFVMYSPLAVARTHFQTRVVMYDSGQSFYEVNGSAFYNVAMAVNAIKFAYNTRNIASGTIRLYGYEK